MAKSKKLEWDGMYGNKHYVKCWKEKREWIVQVWINKIEDDGEPDGDWAMPGILPMQTAIDQAVVQSELD